MVGFYCLCVSPPVDPLPIVLSYYNPTLGGINCDSNCSVLADGTLWDESMSGNVAACLPEWLGYSIRLGVMGLGSVKCRDVGGLIKPYYSRYHGRWVIPVDVLWLGEYPAWNQHLVIASYPDY
jgi:hypothetical protein